MIRVLSPGTDKPSIALPLELTVNLPFVFHRGIHIGKGFGFDLCSGRSPAQVKGYRPALKRFPHRHDVSNGAGCNTPVVCDKELLRGWYRAKREHLQALV
jgi:hypothetical protein